ncbi:conserved Plasmodium protein, unknown function [Plasmodium berghei]|uniref:Uncharacterized protein n=2 Tax=Plasmodium berghei TaxID=5821 RepID=A0A509AN54_PLABA|nr:conserved Plasmodium protein, unknown function [Plasmodium berghei ANKA]CXI74071.1 conserved Plasmodium protein, unknown function [Plasmodium berghei]SCM24638.1 conserved Plasmodium protein, unknown function [Plasmodium berghei]SCN27125.1 conserved Plasmodium protein, unknown function [Plasmodium berghei]SCO61641.1 conserved Plasmodium protein, unknown function [Plasmodium berghei]SCO63548.1 conserved Plasmodium protein, unknown function [Plasmodium berghei]|eukprot:XP_034422759.1 conserved Plasmodium protein, unknown function [Plasmodium berghei ANKA]
MNNKKRKLSDTIDNHLCDVEKNDKKKEENIKNLKKLLNNYINNNDLDDLSDYLASTYKDFLINSIYEELKCQDNRNLGELISICLDIIEKNHKNFKHQNVYFVCLNTLFLLLNRIGSINNYIEYNSFKIFYDLIINDNDWSNNKNSIEIFAKLNYINLFIVSNTFLKCKKKINCKKNIDFNKSMPIQNINKIVKHVFSNSILLGNTIVNQNYKGSNFNETRDYMFDNTYINKYVDFISSYKTHVLNNPTSIIHMTNENNKKIGMSNQDKEISILYKKVRTENRYKELENNNMISSYINSQYKNSNYINDTNKMIIIKSCFFPTMKNAYDIFDNPYDNLFLQIYTKIIHLIINTELTIYIIYECVYIILNTCEIHKQELLLFDLLLLYKFYIKNDNDKMRRFIIFYIHLIIKCKHQYKKLFFMKLVKNINPFFYLLYVDNPNMCIYAKEFISSLDFFNANDTNIFLNNMKNADKNIDINMCAQIEIIRIMNVILFLLDNIYNISVNIYVDAEFQKIEYNNFYNNCIWHDPLFKNYTYYQMSIKKKKLFFKCKNPEDKNIKIRNIIIEIENMIKTFDYLFKFVRNREWWNISLLFFFIHSFDMIKKICRNLPCKDSKKFFFLTKNLFMQAIYVFENFSKIGNSQLCNYENMLTVIEKFYTKNDIYIMVLFNQTEIKKLIEKIKLRTKEKNSKPILILLEALYLVIIDFLFPKDEEQLGEKTKESNKQKKIGTFFNPNNFSFLKTLLLRISYSYYYLWSQFYSINYEALDKKNIKFSKLSFFETFYNRIKDKLKIKLDLKKMKKQDIFLQNVWLNYSKIWENYLCVKKSRYISPDIANYFTFCFDFFKILIMYENEADYTFNRNRISKIILNMCKIIILKYQYFLPAKNIGNCFSSSIEFLYHLYISIYNSKKSAKLMNKIAFLIFLCCNKAMNDVEKGHVIFYNNCFENGEMKRICYDISEKCLANSQNDNNINKNYIIIKDKFQKHFNEYYLNTSLHVFITCLNVLTDTIKITISKVTTHKESIIIKKSKIKNRKKKENKYKFLKYKNGLILFNYTYLSNLCKCLIKNGHKYFFYSSRKYVLNFIQHFISMSTIILLKYKFKNNLNLKKILKFCFYSISTDCDISTLIIIHRIVFSIKNHLKYCGTKIKKAHRYLRECDDLMSIIVQESHTYNISETNLWEEYISQDTSFDSLKHTIHADCPGN